MTTLKQLGDDHPDLAIFGVDDVPQPRTLVDIAADIMARYPDEIALESDDEQLTYRQLRQRIDTEVARLAERGIGRGDRIGIRVPSGTTDLYVAILATLFAGAAYVPVDWDDPDSRAVTVWQEAGVVAVYGAELALEEFSSAQRFPVTPEQPSLTDDAWIIFTSGSTGKPKGVAITHRSAAALVDAEQRMYLVNDPLGPGDRVMAGLSVAFDASCEEMWLAWATGATLVAAHRDVVRSGESLGEWITSHRISAISTVPTLAAFWPDDALQNIRLLIFGGEACPLELVERLTAPGREVWNTYGPTEATVIATGELMTGAAPVRIGRPTPGWELVVVDEEEQPVAWGETGQLIVGGVGLGRYLDPVKDAEAYAALPSMNWERAYRTGDLVVAEPEGLIFAGRADDQIKFAGRRLELGEIDDHLSAATGVQIGAARLNKTDSGSDVLVGYLVAQDGCELDLSATRAELAATMPGGIVPVLCVLDEMPIKTSGKVDRKALPWPLPVSEESEDDALPAHLTWLATAWRNQLGPVPLGEESDFFELGGSSVAVAKLAVDLRAQHPTADIGELYAHPTLAEMHAYLSGLEASVEKRPEPAALPRDLHLFQTLWIAVLTCITAARYVLSALIAVWLLSVVFDAAWVPRPMWQPLLVGWLILYTPIGRAFLSGGIIRLLTGKITAGSYARGGREHRRLWAAERLFHHLNLEALEGSPFAPLLFRLFGNQVGRNAAIGTSPSVTGLVVIGDNVTIEKEVDLSGYWVDGDTVHVGDIYIGDDVRIGRRSSIAPNTVIGDRVEIEPGSYADGLVRSDGAYVGSPLVRTGEPGESWPEENPEHYEQLGTISPWVSKVLYVLGMTLVTILPILAAAPGTVFLLSQTEVLFSRDYHDVFLLLLALSLPFVITFYVSWIALAITVVRTVAGFIRPGYFPENSVTGWALWLTQLIMRQALETTYFLFASNLTPYLLRLFGAHVGKNTEISTVSTIPHLTTVQDGAFLADDALANAPRHGFGWIQVGTTVIGERSFVGNSAIVGCDRDMPVDSLLAVISTSTDRPEAGSSWMGRQPAQIPRIKEQASAEASYVPTRGRKLARVFVEALRVVPVWLTFALDVLIVYALTAVYVELGMSWASGAAAILAAPLIVTVVNTVSSFLPVAAKWLLVGRFRPGKQQLHSSFVWRNELVDNFTEIMAVPTFVYLSLGTRWFNWWARSMGAQIGRDAWVETWWLPEFDLIRIGDRATVNRGTVVQTHLFHDRVMSLERVEIHDGATLGPDSFILPGSAIGERTTVGPASLILRQDEIPADGYWQGNPVRPVTGPGAGPGTGPGADADTSARRSINEFATA